MWKEVKISKRLNEPNCPLKIKKSKKKTKKGNEKKEKLCKKFLFGR